MRAKFEIFGDPGPFFEEALAFRFMLHNENVFHDHGWRRSDGVFVVGLLQVFIVNISKLLKF